MARRKRIQMSWDVIPHILAAWDGLSIPRATPLPADLHIVDVAVRDYDHRIDFIVESVSFEDVPDGAEVPVLDVCVTVFCPSEYLIGRLAGEMQQTVRTDRT